MPLSPCERRRPLVPAVIVTVPPLWLTMPFDDPATCPACTARPMRTPLVLLLERLVPVPILSVEVPETTVAVVLLGFATCHSLTVCALDRPTVKVPVISATS